jgi:CBS domain-containing protein
MEKHCIRHLPVQAAGQVVGMVSDRDLLIVGARRGKERNKRSKAQTPGLSRVADVMSAPVHGLSPDDAVRTATWLMVSKRIHAIPLIRGDRLVGLVTESDVLQGVIAPHALLQPNAQQLLRQPVMSYMREKLRTTGPTTSLDEVIDIMLNERIRHLPVVDDKQLLGIVSDRDVRRALGRAAARDAEAQESGEFFLGPTEVGEVMTKTVRTIVSSTATVTAIEELLRHKIHCLPVVDNAELLGLITDTDLLQAIGAADKEDSRHNL